MMTSRSGVLWVFVLATLLFTWNLWGYDLWAPDEPFFGEGAREMVADGQWLVPHVNGVVSTDKPPLFFWLIALFSLPFGSVSSVTARLPSVLAALLTLGLTMRFARKTADQKTSLLAGVLLVTTYMFLDKARSSQIDALLCLLILIALSAFASFRAEHMPGRRAGLIFWAACALAVLAKGPVGLLLPLGISLLTLALDRDLGRWRRFAPIAGPLAFFSVLAPWLIAVTFWAQDYSVWGALQKHFLNRAIHGMHHAQPFWYYAGVIPHALLPWSLLLPGALFFAWRRRHQPTDRFLLVWALFVIIFFSISTEKRDLYILPAVPALALMSARLIAAIRAWWPADVGLRGAIPGPRWVSIPQAITGAIIVLAGIAAPIAAARQGAALLVPGRSLAAVLILGGGLILAFALAGKLMPVLGATAGTLASVFLLAATLAFPAINPQKSGRELATVVRDTTATARAAGHPVLALDLGNIPRWVNLYSPGIYLPEIDDPAALGARIPDHAESYLLANEASLAALDQSLRQRMTPMYSTRLSRRDIVLLRIAP